MSVRHGTPDAPQSVIPVEHIGLDEPSKDATIRTLLDRICYLEQKIVEIRRYQDSQEKK